MSGADLVFPFGQQRPPAELALEFVQAEGCVNSIGLGLRFGWEVEEARRILEGLEKAGKVRRSPTLRAISYGGGSAYDWEPVPAASANGQDTQNSDCAGNE